MWLRESVREYVSITPEHITSHQQITYNETTQTSLANFARNNLSPLSCASTSLQVSAESRGKMLSRFVGYDFAVVIQSDRFDDGIDPTTWLI